MAVFTVVCVLVSLCPIVFRSISCLLSLCACVIGVLFFPFSLAAVPLAGEQLESFEEELCFDGREPQVLEHAVPPRHAAPRMSQLVDLVDGEIVVLLLQQLQQNLHSICLPGQLDINPLGEPPENCIVQIL